jgi:hypothetical protein
LPVQWLWRIYALRVAASAQASVELFDYTSGDTEGRAAACREVENIHAHLPEFFEPVKAKLVDSVRPWRGF